MYVPLARARILDALVRSEGPLRVGQLAKESKVAGQQVSGLVHQMAALHEVERSEVGRFVEISLTDHGRHVASFEVPKWRSYFQAGA